MPIFAETLARLKAEFPELRVVVATVPTVAAEVTEAAARWPVPAIVLRDRVEKYDAFAAADAALAASGTVALELALASTPMVIAYKVNFVTAALLRLFLMRVRFANLINLMLDRALIPELLQFRCRPDRLAEAVGRLLRDPAAGAAQIAATAPVLRQLGRDGPAPSTRAARTILGVIAGATRWADLS